MKPYFLSRALALLLVAVFVTPSALLVSPQEVYAIPVIDAPLTASFNTYAGIDVPVQSKTGLNSVISAIKNTITSIASVTAQAHLYALVFDTYVLQPLAFVLSGNLLKAMTAGTIAFVIGKANGTGLPQFVADIQVSLQTVSDAHALSFFEKYIRSSQSPWNTAIISQLSKEYLNKTSLAGFWAQNMDTLRRTSPNIYGYLNGVWAAGGVGAWFALTTQTQNNPFMLYPAAQNQLANMIGPGVGGATGARIADINNGQGFVSWCGGSDGFLGSMSTGVTSGANAAAVDQAANDAYDQAYNAAVAAGNESGAIELAKAASAAAKADAFNRAKAANAGNTVLGVSPGDPCTNADGTTGTIKTPGSVIVAGLNKVLGGQQDNVVRMGNVGPQINMILSDIGAVLKTVQFASQILGGPGSGGLFGVNAPTPGQTRSALQAYANSPGNLGVTNSTVASSAAILSSSGSDMLDRVAQYETAINTISNAANAASTNLASLISYCITQQQIASSTLANGDPTDQASLVSFMSTSGALLSTAQTTFMTNVIPVLSRVSTASTTIAEARAMVQKIQTELNSVTATNSTQYTTDLQTLQTMSPTLTDLATAQQDATIPPTLTAIVDPPGSLSVSGGFLVEKLSLISTNATALQSVCTAPAPTFVPATLTPTPTP